MNLKEWGKRLICFSQKGDYEYLFPCDNCKHLVVFAIPQDAWYVECPNCYEAQEVRHG